MKGRKPILLIGSLGSAVSVLLFGFSRTLWYAIVTRSLHGILNGNIGVAKTYLSEVCDDTNSGRAFGLIGLVFGIASVCGLNSLHFLFFLKLHFSNKKDQQLGVSLPTLIRGSLMYSLKEVSSTLILTFLPACLLALFHCQASL